MGTISVLPYLSGSRIALTVDKTIAHTIRQYRDPYELDISMMWCYCYHLHSLLNLRDSRDEDNFNNTFRNNISAKHTRFLETVAKIRKVSFNSNLFSVKYVGGLLVCVCSFVCCSADFRVRNSVNIIRFYPENQVSGKIVHPLM